MYNLLTEDLITVTRPDNTCSERSLPGVLADCASGQAASFPSVRDHQEHSWHAFLVQLAAISMERNGLPDPPEDEGQWRQMLLDITSDQPSQNPWHLIVNDHTTPAFMQPPVYREDQMAHYRWTLLTPDNMDMLVTSVNHDVKSAVAVDARPEDWIMALLTLQTAHGFSGIDNHGISRMNGGFGNRPGISLAPKAANAGQHVKRDLLALMEFLPELRHKNAGYPKDPGAPALMWMFPWDGSVEDQLQIQHFHPLYIEVCRRIRLSQGPRQSIVALKANSKNRRTDTKSLYGVTGDPWTPVQTDKESPQALTIADKGFTSLKAAEFLLSDKWDKPILARPTAEEAVSDEPMALIAKALARGQGTTSGFHNLRINVRPALKQALRHPEQAIQTYELAQDMEKQYDRLRGFIRDSLKIFASHGEPDGNRREKSRSRAHPATPVVLDKFERLKDMTFWEGLQRELEASPGEEQNARAAWLLNGSDGLVDHARALLEQSIDRLPSRAIQRRKAKDDTLAYLERRLRAKSGFPWLFENNRQKDTDQKDAEQKDAEQKDSNAPEDRAPGPQNGQHPAEPAGPADPADLVANIAGYISQLAAYRRPDIAKIKRLDTDNPDSPAFHNMVARYQLDTLTPGKESKWAWLAKNIAANTPPPGRNPTHPTVHNPYMPLGRALFTAGENARPSAFYSETRLNALLSTRGPSLLYQLARALSVLGQNRVATDWRQTARIVLYQDSDPQAVARELDKISKDYHRAARISRTPRTTKSR